MIDPKEQFIQGKVEKYLRKVLDGTKWIHLSKKQCGKHRIEIYERVCGMLKLMNLNYMKATGYGNNYKIRLVKGNNN